MIARSCGAVLPNPATHGDTHTHECAKLPDHEDGWIQRHECECGVSWAHDLSSDATSATLIRFPSDRVPQIDLRHGRGSPPIRCLICAEPTSGRPTHDYGQYSYHTECRPLFQVALQSAENILEALRVADGPAFQRAYLVRIIAAMSRGEQS